MTVCKDLAEEAWLPQTYSAKVVCERHLLQFQLHLASIQQMFCSSSFQSQLCDKSLFPSCTLID